MSQIEWGIGAAALAVFVAAYVIAILEERLHLRKSVPVLFAAGIIWVMISLAAARHGITEPVVEAVRHVVLEFAELFLFLIVAMTYVNTMSERGVFDALRGWLVNRGLSFRMLFWVTGALAFLISPIADNLTTALVMGAVVLAVGEGRPRFVVPGCINIVVAANAGGVFSPFGDITTLMVWQAGHVSFGGFLLLVGPAIVNWLVPAACLSTAIEGGRPAPMTERVSLEPSGLIVVGLFLVTIALTVTMHNLTHLPAAVGMMFGLGFLKLYGYLVSQWPRGRAAVIDELDDVFARSELQPPEPPARRPLDIFRLMERVEWDTLLFFYGVILCVGGLGLLGYLAVTSQALYGGLGPTWANILVGVLSAIIDNVPVMFAVLSMEPSMSLGQWLLVTLTAGVGGSMLSIGSAAGVALMGQARGIYTFMAHLRWTWAIALGYIASIAVHLLLNGHL